MKMKKYEIICPECKTKFDVKEEIDRFKTEVINSLGFIKEVKELLKQDKKSRKKKRGKEKVNNGLKKIKNYGRCY